MKKFALIFVATLLLLFSCKDEQDIIVDNGDNNNNPLIETYSNAIVEGKVTDAAGNPLVGVSVNYGTELTTTNSDGHYKLENVGENDRSRIWFNKDGYISTQKLSKTEDWVYVRVDATLFEIAESKEINEAGGSITTDEFDVTFPENSFVDKNGNAITGNVQVVATPVFREEENFIGVFPGNFEGRRDDNSVVPIESYGFMDIECSVNGEKAYIAEGKEVFIKFKASANAPATIPLWYYDEIKAEWIEDGSATKVGDFYEGSVTHFTKWNWDVPIDQISYLKGRVVDEEGSPVQGVTVHVIGIDYIFGDRAMTDSLGIFRARIIPNKNCKINVHYTFYDNLDLKYTPLELPTSVAPGDTMYIQDIQLDLSGLEDLPPVVYTSEMINTIAPDEIFTIKGKFYTFDINKLKVILDGTTEITPTELSFSHNQDSISHQLLTFTVPANINDEGVFQVKKGDNYSKEVKYKKATYSWSAFDFPDNRTSMQFVISKNTIYTNLNNSVFQFDGSNWTDITYNLDKGTQFEAGIETVLANDNNVWVVYNDYRQKQSRDLYKLNNDKWDSIGMPEVDHLFGFAADGNDNIWAHGESQGIRQYDGTNWIEHKFEDIGIEYTYIQGVKTLKNGQVYFYSPEQIFTYENNAFKIVYEDKTEQIMDFDIDSDNNLVVLYRNALLLTKGGNTTKKEYENQNLRSIAIDSRDNIWLNDWFNLIYSYDGTNTYSYQSPYELSPYINSKLVIDNDDVIWFITNTQLANLNPYGN